MDFIADPRRALAISLCLFCFAVPTSIAGANIGWGLIAASLLACRLSGLRWPAAPARSPVFTALLLYVGAGMLASALGVDAPASLSFLYKDAHKAWIYLLLSAALAIEIPRAATAFLAAGFCLSAAAGLFETTRAAALGDGLTRADGFVHPVVFGDQMAFACLGGLCWATAAGARRRQRLLGWSLTAVFALAMALSLTRTAVVAAAVGSFVVCVWAARPKRAVALWALAVAAGLTLAGGASIKRYGTTLLSDVAALRAGVDVYERPQLARLAFWQAAWRIGRDRPWTGVGINNYRAVLPRYMPAQAQALSGWGNAHNLFLQQFAERGLIGLACVALVFLRLWLLCLKRARSDPSPASVWALACVAAFFVMNLSETAFQTESLWMLLFVAVLLPGSSSGRTPRQLHKKAAAAA